jgi:acyl-coenzyme A thioesterase PaaI-like protein
MVVSERALKWAIRFYPPLFFQRIWVKSFAKGFKGVEVKISKSIFNKNYNNSIFGGTIFSAADPFYPLLFHQIFLRRGHNVIVWLKSAQVQYLKPAATNMHFSISIPDETILEAEQMLVTEGKFIRTFTIEILDNNNEVCAIVQSEAYARLLP